MTDISNIASSNFDYSPTTSMKFDWSFNTQPAIQPQSMSILNDVMCLELNPVFLNNSGMYTVNINLDPVTNCKDRTYGQGY